MQEEYKFFIDSATWELILLLLYYSIIRYKWVFIIIRDAIDYIGRCKRGLVAKDYSQVVGLILNEIFILLAKFTIIRTVFSN